MTSYIIKATNLSSESGTVVADVGFGYSDNLNDFNEAEIKISGTSSVRRSLLEIGSEIEIKRNGTVKFLGILDNISYLEAGAVVFHVTGYNEFWLAKDNGNYANSPWTSTASATIFGDIIGESTKITAGTVNAGFAIDFRLNKSQSLWNGITNLAKKTTQDVQMDYINKEIDILDHRGSSSSVGTFNENINIGDVRVNLGYPLGNHILVFGKGDGDNQIKGSAQDATSISTYGRIKRTIIDRSIISTAEANKLADAELALTKDPPKIIDFDFFNPNESVSTGDIITLNAIELSDEEVRIVGLERGIKGEAEFLTAQVTNPALKTLMRRRNKILARLTKDQIDEVSYMEGSGNVSEWGSGINAKTNFPLKVGFFVSPTYMQDEAGNLRTTSLTVDYDLDKYQNQFGTASFTGSDPQVQNSSGNTQPDVENSSGSTQPDVENSSGSTQPDVENSSGNTGPGVSGNSSSITPTATAGALSFGTNTDGAAVNTFKARVQTFENLIGSPSFELGRGSAVYLNVTGAAINVTGKIETSGGFASTLFTNQNLNNNTYTSSEAGSSSAASWTNDFYRVWDDNDLASYWWGQVNLIYSHTHSSHLHADGTYSADSHLHSDGTYNAANHGHGDGTYNAANHAHDDGTYNAANHGHPDGTYDINAADINQISIGDDVDEAAAVNASSVNLYLDFWNGSAWINKHSILNTGSILDNDVDISDSGTYPDATGFWRIRVEPITGSADFAQGIVKLKYHLDN